ncbi:MAG: cytochrome b/b6 domain-containing protein [Vulcanimicrobiaceae bacterium]
MEQLQRAPIERHSLSTRLAHWAISFAFLALLPSGGLIFFHLRHLPFSPKSVHLWSAGVAIAGALIYAFQGIANGGFRRIFFTARDRANVLPMAAYYLRLGHTPPAYSRYNPLQKLAYTTVVFVLAPLALVTGLAMWPHAPFAHPLAQLFGGRAVRWWHIGAVLAIAGFVAGHVPMVVTTGWRENMRSMWFATNAHES